MDILYKWIYMFEVEVYSMDYISGISTNIHEREGEREREMRWWIKVLVSQLLLAKSDDLCINRNV